MTYGEINNSSFSAFIDSENERTIFDVESEKVQVKINGLVEPTPFMVKYQGDPRGATVKIKYTPANQSINPIDCTGLL